jgi:hypothetical protein
MDSMEQFQKKFDATSEVDLLKKHRIKITEKIDPPPPVIQIDNLTQYPITIFTEGNLSVISGKAKARKSFAVAMLTAATVSNDWIYRKFRGVPENKVIYFDTEQSSFYVQQAYKRIDSMSQGDDINKRFYCYALRSLSVQQRVDVIDYVFKHTNNLGFVVIDGIRDLMKDINSAEESTDLSTKLMQWSEESGAHILTVLHENPGSEKLRGHIGTELMNKAETVLGVEKMEGDEKYISKITCRMLRGIDFDDIYFTINQYGVPEILANYIEPEHRTNGLQ